MIVMLLRRILYGLVLASVLLFQITNNNYLAHFLLALSVSLPVLSLLLSLPVMFGCRLQLSAHPTLISRGADAQWSVSIENPIFLPIPRLTVRLVQRNLFTGEKQQRKLVLSGVGRRAPISYSAITEHCGLLELRADKIRVTDYLGLFSMGKPKPEPALLLSMPHPADPGPIRLRHLSGICPVPDAPVRHGLGAEYDLRDYRPGDPMRRVHWKLSSKLDRLVVREQMEPSVPTPLFTFDRFGSPEQLDETLDRLFGVCRTMLAVQQPHTVLWLDKENQPATRSISDERALQNCLADILSTPAPLTGSPIQDNQNLIGQFGRSMFHLHIAAGEGAHP